MRGIASGWSMTPFALNAMNTCLQVVPVMNVSGYAGRYSHSADVGTRGRVCSLEQQTARVSLRRSPTGTSF